MSSLLFVGIIAPTNVEVPHFVRVLAGGNDTEVVSELLLLQVSLGQVFKLPLAELQVGRARYGELGSVPRDGNIVSSEGSRLSTNLDPIMEVLFKLRHLEDFIVHGLCAVNHKLDDGLLSLDLLLIRGTRVYRLSCK